MTSNILYAKLVKISGLTINILYAKLLQSVLSLVAKSAMCGSRKRISIPPSPLHGGSRNFLGVGGSKRDKFPKGRGVHKEFFFPEGLKCDRINTYVFFPIDSGNQEKRKVLSMEIDLGFLVILFSIIIPVPDDTYSTEAHL